MNDDGRELKLDSYYRLGAANWPTQVDLFFLIHDALSRDSERSGEVDAMQGFKMGKRAMSAGLGVPDNSFFFFSNSKGMQIGLVFFLG